MPEESDRYEMIEFPEGSTISNAIASAKAAKSCLPKRTHKYLTRTSFLLVFWSFSVIPFVLIGPGAGLIGWFSALATGTITALLGIKFYEPRQLWISSSGEIYTRLIKPDYKTVQTHALANEILDDPYFEVIEELAKTVEAWHKMLPKVRQIENATEDGLLNARDSLFFNTFKSGLESLIKPIIESLEENGALGKCKDRGDLKELLADLRREQYFISIYEDDYPRLRKKATTVMREQSTISTEALTKRKRQKRKTLE